MERRELEAWREELLLLGNEWSAQALEVSLERLRPDQRARQARVTAALGEQFSMSPARERGIICW